MERLLKRGYSYQISQKDLRAVIMQVRGIDKRTFKQWEDVLITLEYLKLVSRSLHARTYEMNVAKVPTLFATLKEQPQTRIG